MVHLAFFDNFNVPSPPLPRTMLGQCTQSVPLEATLYGGEGGGPSLGKRAAFIIEQGAIMKTKQIFKVYHILLTRIVGLNDRAQRPVILFGALSFSSVPSFSESHLVFSDFYQRYFELEVSESVHLRWKVARFSCITLLFASDITTILDLRHRFRHESEATLMKFEGMSFLQLFTWKVVRGFMNINKIQWILIYAI